MNFLPRERNPQYGIVCTFPSLTGTDAFFFLQCVMDVGIQQLWHVLYPGDETPRWNPQCSLNEVGTHEI